MINGKIHYKWSFSIAMLNYQRVTHSLIDYKFSRIYGVSRLWLSHKIRPFWMASPEVITSLPFTSVGQSRCLAFEISCLTIGNLAEQRPWYHFKFVNITILLDSMIMWYFYIFFRARICSVTNWLSKFSQLEICTYYHRFNLNDAPRGASKFWSKFWMSKCRSPKNSTKPITISDQINTKPVLT